MPLDAMGALASSAHLQRQRQQQHTRHNVDGRASGARAREHVGGRCAPLPWSFLMRQSAVLPAQDAIRRAPVFPWAYYTSATRIQSAFRRVRARREAFFRRVKWMPEDESEDDE